MRNFEYRENPADRLNALHKKAEDLIEKHALKMTDFNDFYTPESVKKDILDTDRMRQTMWDNKTTEERESTKLATVMEAIIFEHGEQSNWFGPDAFTIKTTPFDDYINKIDGLVEWVDQAHNYSHAAFGVDATYGHYIEGKLERIRSWIERGKLGQIKYFKSENVGMRGELKNVPLFVIAIRPATINTLADLWAEGNNKALASDPIQLQMLEEILIQSAKFQGLAEKIGQPDIARIYSRVGNKIGTVLNNKMANLKKEPPKDDAYFELEACLDSVIK